MNHPELLSDSPVPSPQDQTEPQRWLERLPQHCAPRNSIRRTLWDKLRRRVKALPPHSWRGHRDSRQRMHEALPPFVDSFPIR